MNPHVRKIVTGLHFLIGGGLCCFLIVSYIERNIFNLILGAEILLLNTYILGQRIKGINIG